VHERIDLACGVIAGEHRLTIQLLRDLDSRVKRGIVLICTSTDRDTAGPAGSGQQHHCCRVGCGADPARSDQR